MLGIWYVERAMCPGTMESCEITHRAPDNNAKPHIRKPYYRVKKDVVCQFFYYFLRVYVPYEIAKPAIDCRFC